MEYLEKIIETIKKRKPLFMALGILLIAAVTWIYIINPAAALKNSEINEVGVYSSSTKTLWEITFSPEDLKENDSKSEDFDYNALFAGEALENIKTALRSSGRSYYLFGEPKIEDPLYAINIPISDDEGYTFIISDIIQEANGNFVGYKYTGTTNGEKKWIGYKNPQLGITLLELRIKNW